MVTYFVSTRVLIIIRLCVEDFNEVIAAETESKAE